MAPPNISKVTSFFKRTKKGKKKKKKVSFPEVYVSKVEISDDGTSSTVSTLELQLEDNTTVSGTDKGRINEQNVPHVLHPLFEELVSDPGELHETHVDDLVPTPPATPDVVEEDISEQEMDFAEHVSVGGEECSEDEIWLEALPYEPDEDKQETSEGGTREENLLHEEKVPVDVHVVDMMQPVSVQETCKETCSDVGVSQEKPPEEIKSVDEVSVEVAEAEEKLDDANNQVLSNNQEVEKQDSDVTVPCKELCGAMNMMSSETPAMSEVQQEVENLNQPASEMFDDHELQSRYNMASTPDGTEQNLDISITENESSEFDECKAGGSCTDGENTPVLSRSSSITINDDNRSLSPGQCKVDYDLIDLSGDSKDLKECDDLGFSSRSPSPVSNISETIDDGCLTPSQILQRSCTPLSLNSVDMLSGIRLVDKPAMVSGGTAYNVQNVLVVKERESLGPESDTPVSAGTILSSESESNTISSSLMLDEFGGDILEDTVLMTALEEARTIQSGNAIEEDAKGHVPVLLEKLNVDDERWIFDVSSENTNSKSEATSQHTDVRLNVSSKTASSIQSMPDSLDLYIEKYGITPDPVSQKSSPILIDDLWAEGEVSPEIKDIIRVGDLGRADRENFKVKEVNTPTPTTDSSAALISPKHANGQCDVCYEVASLGKSSVFKICSHSVQSDIFFEPDISDPRASSETLDKDGREILSNCSSFNHSIPCEAWGNGIDTEVEQTMVKTGEPLIKLQDSFLDDESPHSSLDDKSRHSSLDDKSSHSSLDYKPSHSSIDDMSPHSSLDDKPPHSSLDDKCSHSSLDDMPRHSSLDDMSLHSSLDDKSPLSSLDDKPSHSSIDDKSPYSSLDDKPPHSSLDDKSPHSSLDDEPPHFSRESDSEEAVTPDDIIELCDSLEARIEDKAPADRRDCIGHQKYSITSQKIAALKQKIARHKRLALI